MTIREYCSKHDIVEVEIYESIDGNAHYHTDNLRAVESEPDYDIELDDVLDYWAMGQIDYDNTILANSSIRADFDEWYDDENAQILVVLI